MTEIFLRTDNDLEEFARSLGNPISSRINSAIIDNLVPLPKGLAHSQSLSANFGTGAFPFHTDGAYFPVPPRFIVLRYVTGIADPTPTTICDVSKIGKDERSKLKFDVWKVRSRRSPFYSTILSENELIFRYDRCVMEPVSKTGGNRTYFTDLITSLPKMEIQWEPNKTVVIDNWQSLHARPIVKAAEVNYRTIQRIMIL